VVPKNSKPSAVPKISLASPNHSFLKISPAYSPPAAENIFMPTMISYFKVRLELPTLYLGVDPQP
jgi:hypothetical protein